MFEASQKHLHSVNETWSQHRGVAWCWGPRFLVAGIKGIIHGIIPGVYPDAISECADAFARFKQNNRTDSPAVEPSAPDNSPSAMSPMNSKTSMPNPPNTARQ